MEGRSSVEPANPTEQVLAQVRSPKARDALRDWVRRESAKLLPAGWAGHGFTGAQLLGVNLQGYQDHYGGAILKITERARPGARDKEYRAHRRAVKDSPAFAAQHMAELIGAYLPLDHGGSVMFQRVAGGGFASLAEIDQALATYVDPAAACHRITLALLQEWNTASDSESTTAGAVLRDLLGDRITGDRPIAAWAAGHPHLLADPRPWLSHSGHPLINPFALVGPDSLGGRLPVIATRGRIHGDLHPGNLLIGRTEDDPSYCLVDLARYTDVGLLAWDPAYLVLTTVAKALPVLDHRARDALQHWILDPRGTPQHALPPALRATVIGVHRAATEWGRRDSRSASWEPQRLLALTAVALILTGRKHLLSPELRTWFFWLAARAATELLPRTPEFAPDDDRLVLPDPFIVGDLYRLPAAEAPAQPVTEQAESWTMFAAELRTARLDAPDAATLAARTETLRTLLEQIRATGRGGHLDELAATLDDALRPGLTGAEVRAAAGHADLLRSWLLDELT